MEHYYASLDRNSQLIMNLRDLGRTMRSISEGRGSQKRILIVLMEDGPVTQSALTARLGIQPGSASEVLGKLESAGLIARVPSKSDRRTTDVTLTEEGLAQAQEARRQRQARHEQMFSGLSDSEQEQLLTLLEKLNADWDRLYRTEGRDEFRGRR